MTTKRVKCAICDSMILPATAETQGGLCAQCVKIPPTRRRLAAAVNAEPRPLERAIAMYSSLIESMVEVFKDRDFGAIADPEFTAVRFYFAESVNILNNYHEFSEVGSETAEEIEYYLGASPPGYSLLRPIATKLRSVSPAFNAVGKTVFISSMGMSGDEVAWLIRYLNDRVTFERFLNIAGITEEQVNVYNESYGQELN